MKLTILEWKNEFERGPPKVKYNIAFWFDDSVIRMIDSGD